MTMNLRPNLSTKVLLAVILLSMQSVSNAQIQVNPSDSKYVTKKNAAQHENWLKGREYFPGRPKDMWQIGLGAGSFLVSGDVKSQFGWGTSIHVRKSLGYVVSLRAEYMFGQASGMNYQASPISSFGDVAPYNSLYAPGTSSYANYKIEQHHALSLQGVFCLNNIKFHKKQNKWTLNMIGGVGVNLYRTMQNALDGNGNAYDFTTVPFDKNGDALDLSTLDGRSQVISNIKGILDDSYETNAIQNRNNILTIGKDNPMALNPFVNLGMSFEYLITPRISLALEHQIFLSADDFMDGKYLSDVGGLTSGMDIPQYTSVRLSFHIGNKEKAIQPLWFVNPLIAPMDDISDLKRKLDDEWFKDNDQDGVVNKLDEEPETPEGAPVDAKGKALDSDRDGVADHLDQEPHSPPGYTVNESGVADVPKPLTEKDVQIVKNNDGSDKLIIGSQTFDPAAGKGGMGGGLKEWFLPTLHFDTDKYVLRPEAYTSLAQVNRVMKAYPDMKIVVYGHADSRATDAYNDMLSYNRAMSVVDYMTKQYGFDKNRFVVRYSGKKDNLIPQATTDADLFQNRRVEMSVAKEGETEMGRPENDGGKNRKWKY